MTIFFDIIEKVYQEKRKSHPDEIMYENPGRMNRLSIHRGKTVRTEDPTYHWVQYI